jgi:D-glycero-D-manno-heptose 1,7-bisphosphate phosphatase
LHNDMIDINARKEKDALYRGQPAIFLDRDGTIIEDRGHLSSFDEVVIFPFTFDALRLLQKNFLLFIVTNQSGVALNKVTMAEVARINNLVMESLKSNGIAIQELYCCSHKRDDNCDCIKPKPHFLRLAEKKYGIDLSKSFTIGDHPHDVAFGLNVGATGLYVLTGHGEKHRNDCPESTKSFSNLMDAARWIVCESSCGKLAQKIRA